MGGAADPPDPGYRGALGSPIVRRHPVFREDVLMSLAAKSAAAAAVAALGLFSIAAVADEGWFTQAQAERGHQLFNNYCAECHRPDLTGAAGPALVGTPFLQHWGGQPVATLFAFEHKSMPANEPGSLAPDKIWDITAYILSRNGLKSGNSELAATSAPRTIPNH
jgi:S-disulfanyl-L-cysteine oxidoreductase SoxD